MMKGSWQLCVAAITSILIVTDRASAEPLPLDAYGELPGIETAAISPNGREVAIIGRIQGQRQLTVIDAEHKPRALVPAGIARLRNLRWIDDNSLLMLNRVTTKLPAQFLNEKADLFGALVIPLDGAAPWMVFNKTANMDKTVYGDFGVRIVDGKPQGYFAGLAYTRAKDGRLMFERLPDLYAVDLKDQSLRRTAKGADAGHSHRWLIDGRGNAIVTLDLNLANGNWDISDQRGAKLVKGSNPTFGVALEGFGRNGNTVVYSIDDDAESRQRIFEVPLAGGPPVEILTGINLVSLLADRNDGRLIGYRADGVGAHTVMFDPARQAVIDKVTKAFRGLHVTLMDWTPSFSHVLVRTSGNGDSGSWFIVDVARLRADPVGNEHPTILAEDVGPISIVNYRATDGLELDGILTLPPGRPATNLPVIIYPHGSPNGFNVAGFDWMAQAFASRGFAVFQPNFRGSSHRDDAFRRAGDREWGGKMLTDISDGLAELARRGVVDAKRACIVGRNYYGGYAALAGVTVQKGLYRCAVAFGPVSDVKTFYDDHSGGAGNKVVWRSLRELLGEPSTFDAISPRRRAAEADAPILLMHGNNDTAVPIDQSQAMIAALKAAGKPYQALELKGEDHELSKAATRKQMLQAAMAFVQKYNPAD